LQSVAVRYRHELAVGRGTFASRKRSGVGLVQPASAEQGANGRGVASRDARMARVEAVLFLANEPLGLRKIAQFASLADATEARTLIRRLNQFYDTEGNAFRVEEIAGGFQLLSRRKFGGWVRRLQPAPIEIRLSGPALETLAVVAYRQPVVRAEIEAIRGVQCGEMLRQLMERDLVKIVGRSDELGRPFQYGSTKRFLQVFGLRHLDELPRAEYLRRPTQTGTVAALHAENDPGAGPVADCRVDEGTTSKDSNEEQDVSIVTITKPGSEETLEEERLLLAGLERAAADEDDEEEEDDDFGDEDEDEDDDFDDEDEDDDFDEEEDEDFDDDFDDEDWEEVDDEEEDDEEDEEDEDWDDEDEDEDDDWEEEEEEDDEE
jgi:segregation and condensation protein B